MSRFRVFGFAAALFLLALPAPVDAAAQDPRRVFDLTIDLGDQIPGASILEGGALNLTLAGEEYEVTAAPVGDAGEVVVLSVHRLGHGEPRQRRLVERMTLRRGVPVRMRAHPGLGVVLDGVRRARSAPPPAGTG